MYKVIETQNKSLRLNVAIKCTGTREFRVACSDFGKRNSKYADRTITVNGTRQIYLSFPVSPYKVIVGVEDLKNRENEDFEVVIEEAPLINYAVWIDEPTREFLDMAIVFSQTCGFTEAFPDGKLIKSRTGQFKIKYFPVIKDYMTGSVLNTPARIGHKTGIIEIAKCKFDPYTIPMRMIILLHEYSHKYKNPTMGLEVSNEIGADINALYVYLGLGFSKVDAIHVFANVFLKAQTQGNIERMRKIVEYIEKFDKGEFAKRLN